MLATQRDQAGEIFSDTIRRVRLEKLSAKKKLPSPAQPAERPLPALRGRVLERKRHPERGTMRRPRHSGLDQAAFDQAMPNYCRLLRCALPSHPPAPDGRGRQWAAADSRPRIRSP